MKLIRTLITSVSVLLVGILIYPYFEITEIIAATDTVQVTLNVTGELSITAPANITMSPSITMSQDSSIGTGNAWNVKASSVTGYTMTFKDDSIPALQNSTTSESFTDASSTPSTWGFTAGESCNGNSLCFGFSVYGDDVATTTWGDSTGCGSAGTPNANLNYRGFNGTTTITVASSNTETATSGADTILCVSAEQNGVYAPDGTYETTITGTAVAN